MLIDTLPRYEEFCHRLRSVRTVALDTEFISERTYQPDLCLVQVFADGESWMLDAPALGDLSAFWAILAQPGHETLVIAARSELEFSLRAIGAAPAGLRDLQLAAGFIGLDYPQSAATLHERFLRRTLRKSETRSDWRHRPLAPTQLEYARNDVRYLAEIWTILQARLEERGRMAWFESEMAAQVAAITETFTVGIIPRLPGQTTLTPTQQAALHRISRWRENRAHARNLPPRRVLRDDLVVELARRLETDPERIFAVRGLEHPGLVEFAKPIAALIREAIAETVPESTSSPDVTQKNGTAAQPLIGGSRMTSVVALLRILVDTLCHEYEISPSLAATTDDLRCYVHWQQQQRPNSDDVTNGTESKGNTPYTTTLARPRLALGWRAELFGDSLDRLLGGRLSFTVSDMRLKISKTTDKPIQK